ncbi:DUF2953 domain-containing protein [Neobacillus kokaensis]|uniref:DUF2953 domain-containing protein n=1 Tax=Neobacillus kokaensis TaxID=2759023 RepID=A0ABQ3MYF4_9BACI|nr:DUF2953 domain-containing protein [Neobacillus kokaensis]GHH97299.1 hypothetical protein AM1BK_08420 [Neobacillus kokaensis]
MIWLYSILTVFVFLLLLIIFTKLSIIVNYYHHNDNDDLNIEFRVWFGLIKYKIKVPLIKIDDDSPSLVVKHHSHMGEAPDGKPDKKVEQITKQKVVKNVEKAKDLLQKVIGMHIIIRKFFRKISIKKFEWQTYVGVGDAAHTAIAAGALWTLKASIIGILSHYLKLTVIPKVTITPHFQVAVIQTRLSCIFQFRIGHAILAGLKLIKFWKGEKSRVSDKSNFLNDKTKYV